MHIRRMILILSVVRSVSTCLAAEFTRFDVNQVIDECIREQDIGLVKEWADKTPDHRDSARWDELLPSLVTKDSFRNNILFALYARCCLFAPRDVIRLFKNDYRSPFGEIHLGARTRFKLDIPPNIAMRYAMTHGRSVVVSASLAGVGRRTTPAYVYIGINKGDWKPGDPIRLEDIDFVNTEYEFFFWNDQSSKTSGPQPAAENNAPAGNGGASNKPPAAPRRSPNGTHR